MIKGQVKGGKLCQLENSLGFTDFSKGGFRQVDFTIFVKNPPRETASVA